MSFFHALLSANGFVDLESVYLNSYDLDALNRFIILYFNKPVYSGSGGGVKTSDLSITFSQNGGVATGATISSVKTPSNNTLAGGETAIRINLSFTGNPSGVESIIIQPSTSSSIKDVSGNTGPILNNKLDTIINMKYNSKYISVLTYAIDTLGCVIPSSPYRTIENQWVSDIDATGKWATSDRIFRFSKFGDKQYSLIEWKNPGVNSDAQNMVIANASWAYGVGWTVNTNGWLGTNFVPSTNGVNFTLNDCGIFHASETDVAATNNSDYGTSHSDGNSSKRINLNPRTSASNGSNIGLNSGQGATATGIVSTSIGTFLNDRVSSATTGHDYYFNGALVDGTNFASAGLPDLQLAINGQLNSSGTITLNSSRRISLMIIGASMGTQVAALNTAETTFVSSISAVSFLTLITMDSLTQLSTDTPTNLTTD